MISTLQYELGISTLGTKKIHLEGAEIVDLILRGAAGEENLMDSGDKEIFSWCIMQIIVRKKLYNQKFIVKQNQIFLACTQYITRILTLTDRNLKFW